MRPAFRSLAGAVLALALAAPVRGWGALETTYDEAKAGRRGAVGVEQQVGVIDDPELTAYVQGIGSKLVRAIPRRSFRYTFRVVDQVEPNAFALPGGYIFVSRGLLALVNDEDELACVLGHEIAHVAKRHAAAHQGAARGQFALVSPLLRAGRMAAYSRDLERTADHDGQILCAAAGYDPRGLASFLEALGEHEKLTRGTTSNPGFFDTHPSSGRRATVAWVQASELRWQRDPSSGDPRESLLARIDGLPVGQRPEAGLFRGGIFMHPELDFKLRFPRGWRTSNSNQAVGAQSPRGDAVVFLTGDVPPGDPEQVARSWADRSLRGEANVLDSGPLAVGSIRAWKLDLVSTSGPRVSSHVTFIPHHGSMWRITGQALRAAELKRALSTTRSFRELTDEDRAALRATRLRVVTASADETVSELVTRTGTPWRPTEAAVYNGLPTSHRFEGGERVKIAVEDPYVPQTSER